MLVSVVSRRACATSQFNGHASAGELTCLQEIASRKRALILVLLDLATQACGAFLGGHYC